MGMEIYFYVGPYVLVDNPEVNSFEVADEINENLFPIHIDATCWLPNCYQDDPPFKLFYDSFDDVMHQPMGDYIQESIDWFNQTYKNELEIIKMHYGSYKIHWGTVVYYM